MTRKGHLSQTLLGYALLPFLDNFLYYHYFYYKTAVFLNRTFQTRIFGIYIYHFHKMFYIVFHKSNILMLSITFLLMLTGGIFPDFDLKLRKFMPSDKKNKSYLYHRQITHSLLLWAGVFTLSVYLENVYLFFFACGWFIHLLGDMLTGSVPILLWGKYYHFFSRIGIDKITIFFNDKKKIHKTIAGIGDRLAPFIIIASFVFILKFQDIYGDYTSSFLLKIWIVFAMIYWAISEFGKFLLSNN